ncbi:MAG: hypothetical protein JWL83_202 [Actinomycetia bacterium]|nr:hypothetical protein [Actinomycetes bacterium]
MGRSVFFALAVSAAIVVTPVAMTASSSSAASPPSASPPVRSAAALPVHQHKTAFRAATNGDCEFDVTADVKLTADVSCFVQVLAENVTINLNHHTISGFISATKGTTLRNGTITAPFYAPFAPDVTVDHVVATGVETSDPSAVTVGPNSVIRYSHFVNNGGAIDLFFGGDGSTVLKNTFEGNGVGVWNNGAQDVNVVGNVFTGNTHAVTIGDEDGLAFESARNQVVSNTFRDNVLGVNVVAFVGVRHLTVAHNRFIGNKAAGTSVFIACDQNSCGGAGMVVASNTFAQNGFQADTGDSNSGFFGSSNRLGTPTKAGMRHLVLADNEALANAGLGIDALGAFDGGGNNARNNGDPRQCVGVVCVRR